MAARVSGLGRSAAGLVEHVSFYFRYVALATVKQLNY